MSADVTPIDYASPLDASPPVALQWPVAGVCLFLGVLGVVRLLGDLAYLLQGGPIYDTSFNFLTLAMGLEWLRDLYSAMRKIGDGARPWLLAVLLVPLFKRSTASTDCTFRRRYFRFAGIGLLGVAIINTLTKLVPSYLENDVSTEIVAWLLAEMIDRQGGAIGLLLLACSADDFHRRGPTARRAMGGLICAWSAAAFAQTIILLNPTSLADYWNSWCGVMFQMAYYFDLTLLLLIAPIFCLAGIMVFLGFTNWRSWLRGVAWMLGVFAVALLIRLVWEWPSIRRDSYRGRELAFLIYVVVVLRMECFSLILAVLSRWVADAPGSQSRDQPPVLSYN